jgi:hypothetical protein
MQHPYYPNPDKFKPNGASINAWLKTRKNNSSNKPGIFETVDYQRDRNWSVASILIELAAFLFTFYGAYLQYKVNGYIFPLIAALIVVILFILFDVLGIMLHGHDKPKRVLDRSEFIVTQNPQIKKVIYERLKETTWREFLGFMLLTLSAILKIFALYFFLQMTNVQILIVFTILYLLVIYIHSYHTVYWWPAKKLMNSIKKQSDNFQEYHKQNLPTNINNTIDAGDHWSYSFTSKCKLSENRIEGSSEGRVNVVNIDGNNYLLNCTGLLWDENIVSLVGQWEKEYVNDLIHACITVQLLQVNVIAGGGADGASILDKTIGESDK